MKERKKDMKKLYLIETNSSTMIATYDEEEKVVRLLDNEETNAPEFDLSQVEDDSSWELFIDVEDFEEWLGVNWNNEDAPKIIKGMEF